MQGYRPSLVADIHLIFDESLHIQNLPSPETTQDFVNRPPQNGRSEGTPLILQRGAENASHILNRIPKSASIEFPGYRQAGQFSCEFDFRDLPIDPRTVRAASVDLHIGTIDAADFGAGMLRVETNGTRRSVLQTGAHTLAMVGLVDEWGAKHSGDGSMVAFRGRDLRGVLIDTPIGVAPGVQAQIMAELDWGRPVTEIVQQLLGFNPMFQDIQACVNAAEWPNGVVPAPGDVGAVPRNRRGARGRRSGGRATPNSDSNSLSFWDLIVRACYLVGAIPYFQGRNLLIRPSRSIFDQQRAGIDPNIPTPFRDGQPRTLDQETENPISPSIRVRRMVYGRDVEEFSFDRKYGGFQKPRVVRCVSVDTSSANRGMNRMVEGRWPPAAAPAPARRTRVAPGGQVTHEEILNIPVPGIRDEQRLQEIARSIFEEVGRGEMGGSVSTKSLASFGGDNTDPDLLRLRPGDGVEILVDTRGVSSSPPLVSTFTDFNRTSFEEAVQDVSLRIGDENLARVLVATARGLVQDLQTFFRVSTVKLAWNADSGVKIDFDYQNYVTVRNQLSSPTDDPSAGAVTTVASRSRSRVAPDAPVHVRRSRQ